MKWKITFKYIVSIICVVMIVTILNISGIIGGFIFNKINDIKKPEDKFTRDFSNYIQMKDNNVVVDKEGKHILDKEHIWIQILDENSNEIYRYNAPEKLNKKHTPAELINGYKYAGGFKYTDADNILVSSKIIDNKEYTYILGFDRNSLQKYILTVNPTDLANTVIKIIWIILFIDLIIALIFGYLFSKRLTKPMKNIIEGVENLEEGKYDIYYKEKGLYQSVYNKLNKLADTLKSNEAQRNKLDKLKQEWIANISHDIKTPLSSIKGYAELLSDSDYEIDSEEVKDYGLIINQKSEYIKGLVDDLNLTMKLKSSDRVLNKNEENIVRIIKDSIIQILNDPKYSNRDIEFITNKDVIKKQVDANLFKRVINNLVYNALIHNHEDVSIIVSIDYKSENDITIFVKDNGKGISKDDLERIFDRYYRGTNTGETHKGSGLGMAIAKEIIVAHGFDIGITSELGAGTTVFININ
ncbi:sensor histidine kinase [Paraclostridium tenue]